ncbi:MAG: hypothetical protein JWM59_3540 [Verrucomicrobiales bacterium]|nr:hypothetical protein [Verrucomicrobiales bacterium]
MPAKKSLRPEAAHHSVTVALSSNVLVDVRELILTARETVARGVNTALVALYWKNRGTHPPRRAQGEARGLWGRDFADTVGKIGA